MILGCLALAFLAVSPAIGIGLLWVRETGGDTASVPWLQLWLVASGSLFLLLLPVCIAGRIIRSGWNIWNCCITPKPSASILRT